MKLTTLLLLGVLGVGSVHASPREDCAREVGEQLPTDDPGAGWHFPNWTLHPGFVAGLIISGTAVAVLAEGDFDGDKKTDIAYRIETDTAKQQMIAVCLTSTPKVYFITDLQCTNAISTRSKAQWNYPRDAIDGSCSDLTRVRYEFVKGIFHRIEDEIDPDMP